jgi:hypothetical protein
MKNSYKTKLIQLNIPQAKAFINMRQKNYWEWSRGTGKSTALAYGMREFVRQMHRASFFLVGATYSQILSRTLPSTIEGLEMFNLFQDVDYVVGRSGKKNGFQMPFQPPNQWNNVIHFSNGSIFQLVSLDNPNTGRGLNSYGGIGDEAALLDPEKLYNNVKTTNRAKKEIFKKSSMLGAEIYASSTPITKKGKWFIDMEQEAKKRPDLYYFGKANSFANAHNLRKGWFEDMKAESPSELIYNAEILNIRPKEITDGFYANINADRHYYSDYKSSYLECLDASLFRHDNNEIVKEHFNSNQDNDIFPNEPLIVSLDFGVFNSCVVSQVQDDTYRVLNSMWVKSPKLLDDLFIEQFIPYYRPHQNKMIYLYGGHDGNNRLPNSSLTLFEQVRELLTNHGWTVIIMTRGAAATHYDKYLLINAMLKESDRRLPKIRINEGNNPDLIIALERSEAIESNNGVDKNKRDERNKEFPQQHATHLTDAFDIPIVTMYNDIFKGYNLFSSEMQIRID